MRKKLIDLGRDPAAVSGILLLAATLAAVLWANSGARDSYARLWEVPVSVRAGDLALAKPLLLWVNDGLMAVFFLLVGLEIKREILEGTLSTLRRSALPVAAALGGVAAPAGIYLLFNQAPGGAPAGWAIPAATDIAFVLGILALLGSRVPAALRIFLAAVAVVDDLVAVLIIAVLFTAGLSGSALLVAGATLAVLVVLNLRDVRRPFPYVLLGLVLWVAILKSGLHATLAGVLLAATIPARPGRRSPVPFPSPLVQWEHALKPFVLWLVVPVFALANAGVSWSQTSGGTSPVAWGTGLGLLLGKPLGITLLAALAVRLRLAQLPEPLTWRHVHAASWLAGIGFTMSLFLSSLALQDPARAAARTGLLLGSAAAAVIGTLLLWRACPRLPAPGTVRVPDSASAARPG